MTLPRLQLSVIGDEIGPSLNEMISFAHEHGLKNLDMRTVDGRNLLAMGLEEVIHISRTLEKAGISVPTFVSPIFKWKAPGVGTTFDRSKVDFPFDPKQCPEQDWVGHAIQIGVILGAPHMRIFSYLRYGGFTANDPWSVSDHLARLHGAATHYDITLQIENEPVCNIGTLAEQAAFFAVTEERRLNPLPTEEDEYLGLEPEAQEAFLRPLIDIANAWAATGRPDDANIAFLAPIATAIHLKDRDLSTGRTVPLGDGGIPWADELKRLLSQVETKEVLASIETHCPQDARNATARSVAAFRRIAAEIGAEVV